MSIRVPLYVNALRYLAAININRTKHLLVQSQMCEHLKKLQNMFQVNNKDTRAT